MAPLNCVSLDPTVTYCSSESEVHKANNTLLGDTFRVWQSADATTQATIEYQFDRPHYIRAIDVTNAGSAFIEILVGQATWEPKEFQVMVQMTTFMTQSDSKDMTNKARIKRFDGAKLNSQTTHRRWEKVRVVCMQPFNPAHIGIANIKFYTKQVTTEKLNRSTEASAMMLTTPTKSKSRLSSSTPTSLLRTPSQSLRTPEKENNNNFTDTTDPDISMTDIETTPTKLMSDATEPDLSLHVNTTPKPERSRTTMSSSIASNIPPGEFLVVSKKSTTSLLQNTPRKGSTISNDDSKVPMDTDKPSKASSKLVEPQLNDDDTDCEDDVQSIVEPKKEGKYNIPFNQLLKGVVIVIGGIVNPEKAQLRVKALEMGADYKPDWCKEATHLITPFIGTPKSNACDGAIVLPTWINDCYKMKTRLPIKSYQVTETFKPKTKDSEQSSSSSSKKSSDKPGKSISTAPSKKKKKGKKTKNVLDPSDSEDEDDGLPNAYDLNDDFIDNEFDGSASSGDEEDSDLDLAYDEDTRLKSAREQEDVNDLFRDAKDFLDRTYGNDKLVKQFYNKHTGKNGSSPSSRDKRKAGDQRTPDKPAKKLSYTAQPFETAKVPSEPLFDQEMLFSGDGTQEISPEQIKSELERVIVPQKSKVKSPTMASKQTDVDMSTDEEEDVLPEHFVSIDNINNNNTSSSTTTSTSAKPSSSSKQTTTTTTTTTTSTSSTSTSNKNGTTNKDTKSTAKSTSEPPKTIVKGKEYILNPLPTFFDGVEFYLSLKDESLRKQVQRYIVAYKGSIKSMPTATTKYIITDKDWDKLFDITQKKYASVVFLKPSFIMKSHNYQKIAPIDGHVISKA
ncbi:hypothetical protein SAMD00019534_002940 [Acytostelium subglobosum LB1]|uniref:hypothetical protein n=1 Tax=Acytostelium subglobosum LB1 TaxID=1410327 RepID=UPI0006448671|nr:hypothetical protein SAMD00019534_002940 [Acytostelium subglobosum LB1]GAM17119.1 hypothetical protein SAMD00019534_002940 [Acytostelium subglobosum LB1]|eukprot:XP_012759181.1 hypothetical protein SAMD00019534_002940 [Acytostelium subglobosum LB1]